MSLPYNKKLIPRARDLRNNATRQERHLWYDFLNTYPLRFQRQKVIGQYIVDFFCHAARLVIELDGRQHEEEAARQYDEERTNYLAAAGLRVLRFPNTDVDRNFAKVCIAIDEAVKQAIGVPGR